MSTTIMKLSPRSLNTINLHNLSTTHCSRRPLLTLHSESFITERKMFPGIQFCNAMSVLIKYHCAYMFFFSSAIFPKHLHGTNQNGEPSGYLRMPFITFRVRFVCFQNNNKQLMHKENILYVICINAPKKKYKQFSIVQYM